MRILLSIKPEFAFKIFDGTKKYEFRRTLFKNPKVSKVVVYASAPISKVIGEFDIETVLHKELSSLWNETKKWSGISEDYYYSYFEGKQSGFAIKVKSTTQYDSHQCLNENFGVKPPQSFLYLD